jgi:hypothetical protein
MMFDVIRVYLLPRHFMNKKKRNWMLWILSFSWNGYINVFGTPEIDAFAR